MYQVYAASAYIIHDNNFLSYCKPALRSLPTNTACRLASLRQKTEDLTPEIPPNQKTQSLSTTQTKPEFANPRPTYSGRPLRLNTALAPPTMGRTSSDVLPEPELGPCLITKLGPTMERQMLSRTQMNARGNPTQFQERA
jgi:hypothetical protein